MNGWYPYGRGGGLPGHVQEFQAFFPDEAACVAYLVRVRWPDGFVCPRCSARSDAWPTGRGLLMCRQCGRQTSVRAGTIFHGSRMSLSVRFAAMWFVCSSKTGTSALALQNQFGFGSYETAWAWMHKLRRAMVVPGRELLGGDGVTVEVDQTFVGGRKRAGKSAARYANKAEVAVAVERINGAIGRIRLAHIDTARRGEELAWFISNNLAHGTVLATDGSGEYATIAKKYQFTHQRVVVSAKGAAPAHETLPAIHQVASLLKRWLAGTMHYGQEPGHLQYYLDEYTFRFNRRHSRRRGLLWYRLVCQACETPPHPLATLTHPQNAAERSRT